MGDDNSKYDDYTAADYRADIEGLTDELDASQAENVRLVIQNEGLTTAQGTRAGIGQAVGVLMERHKITADQAFGMLVEASQRLNVKLVAVAEDLTRTGELQ